MFLELLHDIVINSSLSSMYFSMFIMTIGLSYIFILKNDSWPIRTHVSMNDYASLQVNGALFEKPVISYVFFIEWFVKMFSRIDKLDCDDEDGNITYFKKWSVKIRGGHFKLWKRTAYLHLITENY